MDGATSLLHATCIALEGRAALILGPPGAGKSDLALRACTGSLRDGRRMLRPRLVADDQVVLEMRDGCVIARPPATIAGRIEVRGVGILEVDWVPEARLCLAVDVGPGIEIERIPEPDQGFDVLGQRVPLLRLRPFEASAAVKLVLALSRLDGRPGVGM